MGNKKYVPDLFNPPQTLIGLVKFAQMFCVIATNFTSLHITHQLYKLKHFYELNTFLYYSVRLCSCTIFLYF